MRYNFLSPLGSHNSFLTCIPICILNCVTVLFIFPFCSQLLYFFCFLFAFPCTFPIVFKKVIFLFVLSLLRSLIRSLSCYFFFPVCVLLYVRFRDLFPFCLFLVRFLSRFFVRSFHCLLYLPFHLLCYVSYCVILYVFFRDLFYAPICYLLYVPPRALLMFSFGDIPFTFFLLSYLFAISSTPAFVLQLNPAVIRTSKGNVKQFETANSK